ncbi:MAG: hypothetical protein QOC61_2075 [Acidobacteriota bacterium]|jgi:hypothetical protein|nr:hypothetical protein [Acidobacteriota bacterium]
MKRWLFLLLVVVVALAFVVVPVFLIQPFRPQTGRALEVGYELHAWAPWVTIAAALLSVVLVARMWRGARRWWAKVLMVVLLLPVAASVWFARQNVYEWMFNPLAGATYARADEVNYVGDEDMVLAVERGGEAVAYPVRLLAYHHIVADTVGGVPIAATY